jgi:hypothetical protein
MGVSQHMIIERMEYLNNHGYQQVYGFTSHPSMKNFARSVHGAMINVVKDVDENGKKHEA